MSEKTDQLIPLSEVPHLEFLPKRRAGSRLALSTLFRWSRKGVRGRRLQTWKVGGQRCTTVAALHQFFEFRIGSTSEVPTPQTLVKPRQLSEKGVAKALDKLGI